MARPPGPTKVHIVIIYDVNTNTPIATKAVRSADKAASLAQWMREFTPHKVFIFSDVVIE